ncbi:MAG: MFS transporter [Chromatiaceae bacterium]|nr:MFS transporter [Chromatiaceae bacterium]
MTDRQRILWRVIEVRRGEGWAVFWSFLYFFFLLGSYYILRPVRDEMGVTTGVDRMQWLFTGTFIAMLVVVPFFGWITSRYRRRQFLPAVYGFFIINILLFYLLFESEIEIKPVAALFFVWLSVFNLFVVSVFWSFMADLFRNEQAKRLFGFIATGGTAGAITGPAMTALLVQQLGTGRMLLLSAVLLGMTLICIRRLIAWQERITAAGEISGSCMMEREQPLGGGVLNGFFLVLRSPYLLGICALIVLYASLSTFLYLQQAQIVRDAFDDSATRTAVFASMDFAVNVLTLVIQAFFTGRLVKWLGLAMTLALIPILLGVGFLMLAMQPVLPVLIAVQVIRRAGNYAIMRPAREMLYVVVRREEKYKAKNFIDTVVYRGGDAISSWVYTGMRGFGLTLSAIAWIALPLSLVWAWIALRLGRQQAVLGKSDQLNREE